MFNDEWVWENTVNVKVGFKIRDKYWERFKEVAQNLGVPASRLVKALVCTYLWFNKMIDEDELRACDGSGLAKSEEWLTNAVEAMAYLVHDEDDSINFLLKQGLVGQPKRVVLEV